MCPYFSCTDFIASKARIWSPFSSPIPTNMPVVKGILSLPASSSIANLSFGSLPGDFLCASSSEVVSSIKPIDAFTGRSSFNSALLSTPKLQCGSNPRFIASLHISFVYSMREEHPKETRRSVKKWARFASSGFSPAVNSASVADPLLAIIAKNSRLSITYASSRRRALNPQ